MGRPKKATSVVLNLIRRAGWYRSHADEVKLCVMAAREYVDLGKANEVDLVLTSTKPKGDDYFTLKYNRSNEFWYITDVVDTDRSPWICSVDSYLSQTFIQSATLYAYFKI